MCGRYVLDTDGTVIAFIYGVPKSRERPITRRFNVAPTQDVPVIRQDRDGRRVDLLKWGLIPFWAKDKKVGYKLTNARAEDIDKKPSFREAFKRRRCLIPASGFYEWKEIIGQKAKQPFYITLQSGELMSFAGLWESWQDPTGERIESCVIITTEANEMLAKVHDRMPVLLDKPDWNTWFDTQSDRETLLHLLQPYPSDEMRTWPVSPRVNKSSEEGAALIDRIDGL